MLSFFRHLRFRSYDLTSGQVDYPQLLINSKDKGPDIPQLLTCKCGAWTNISQGGVCSGCREKEQVSITPHHPAKVVSIRGSRS